jgi:hypothetical protein
MARPTTYTSELAHRICELVAINTCGVDELCASYPEFPDEQTIRLWRFKHPEFSGWYAQAKMFQAELLAEQIHKLSKTVLTYHDSEGNERVDSGFIASQRLQVDSIKWHASKLAPKIYGDKLQTEHSVNESTKEVVKRVADINKENEKAF